MKKIQKTKWMVGHKRSYRLFLAVIAAGLALAGFAGTARHWADKGRVNKNDNISAQQTVDDRAIMEKQDTRPIASVGRKTVPKWMFDNAMNDRLGRGWENKNIPEKEVTKTGKEIIDNLVTMALLESEAEKAGIHLSEGAGTLRGKIIEGSFKNRNAFLTALATAGMTEAQYRKIWQQQAVVNMLITENIEAKVTVAEADVRAIYEERRPHLKQPPQVRARHILIKAGKAASPDQIKAAEKTASNILEKLRQGANFAELAEKYSDCTSKKKGGDLGWFSSADMVPAFSQAAGKLAENEISDVVKTRFGYHIIQKTGFRPEGPASYDTVKNALYEELVKKQTRENLNEYVAALKKLVPIEIYR